jgi:hypothetical protein
MRQSVSGRRHGDAADHSRNLICHFGDLGMGVVPKPFLRPISACYYYRRKIELLKISQGSCVCRSNAVSVGAELAGQHEKLLK